MGWTLRSKSGWDSGPDIQGYRTWVSGVSGRSGGTVKQRPAGSGMSKARLGAIGGGRSRHHCCCGPGRPHTLAVTEGRRRQHGGTKESEAGRRSVTGRCAGRGSESARAPSVSHRAAVPRHWAVRDVIGSKVMRYSVHPFPTRITTITAFTNLVQRRLGGTAPAEGLAFTISRTRASRFVPRRKLFYLYCLRFVQVSDRIRSNKTYK